MAKITPLYIKDKLFEELVCRISANFINIPSEKIDQSINDALEQVGTFLHLDRCSVGNISQDGREMVVTHVWNRDDVPGVRMSYAIEQFPWLLSPFLTGRNLVWSRTEGLPKGSKEDIRLLEKSGMQCFAGIPVKIDGELKACMGFSNTSESKPFNQRIIERFHYLAVIFGNALARRNDSRRIEEAQNRLSTFMENSPPLIYIKDNSLRHVYGNRSILNALGIKLDEFIGTTSHDWMPEEIAKRIESFDKEVLEKGTHVEVDEYNFSLNKEKNYFKEIKFPAPLYGGESGVGGIVIDITSLKQTDESLREQLQFEQLIADIATRLSQAKPAQLKKIIDWTLGALGQFLRTERSFLAQFSEDYGRLSFTNLWAADGIDKFSSIFDTDIVAEVPILAHHIRNGETLIAGPGLTGIPDELRLRLERDGINSGMIIPIFVGGKSIGMLGLDTVNQPREYPQSIVDRLKLVADMIGSVLHRNRSEENLQKAFDEIKLLKEQLEVENIYLRDRVSDQSTHDKLIGTSDAMKYVLYKVGQVSPSDTTVLIFGETGTGKELVAEAMHNNSSRKDRPLIKVNCAALPANLIESELFGREKGAFTGSMTKQIGRFELADKGTIFLDEIGELPLELQAKLLRVIQSGEFERLGSPHTVKVDVRVIASTNRDLLKEVKEGRFREDLYYRLNVFPISVPPLRDRTEDIPLLVNFFLKKFGKKIGKKIERVSYEAIKSLQEYYWPGNVRELENIIERSIIISPDSTLQLADKLESNKSSDTEISQHTSLSEMERNHILKVLKRTRWKIEGKNGAAESLDLNPSTLRTRMRKLGIHRSKETH